MNNITTKNLIALGVLAIFFVSSQSALAYVPGVWDPQPRIVTNEPGFTIVPMPKDTAPVVQTTSTSNTYSSTQVAPVKTVAITPVKSTKTVATTSTTTNRTSTASTSNTQASALNQNGTNYPYNTVYSGGVNSNGLTALSVAGTNSFMPDTIFEWILVILLILAIIVIVRRITRREDHEFHHVVAGH